MVILIVALAVPLRAILTVIIVEHGNPFGGCQNPHVCEYYGQLEDINCQIEALQAKREKLKEAIGSFPLIKFQ